MAGATASCLNLEQPFGLGIDVFANAVAPIAGARRMHANWRGSTLATTVGRGHSLTGDLVPAIVIEYLLKSQK